MKGTGRGAGSADADAGAGGAGLSIGVLCALGLLSALGPLAIDLYLPALPVIASEFGVGATPVQISLTGYLIGVAVGQLTFGPLSDRYGRIRPLVAGLLCCLLASMAAAFAPTLAIFVLTRVIQGFGAAAGAVIARAIISDIAIGDAAARAFSWIMIFAGVAPIIAPSIGGVVAGVAGWRSTMVVIGIAAAVLAVVVVVLLGETHRPERRAAHRAQRSSATSSGLASRGFIGNAVAMVFSSAVMLSYIAGSPFLFQTVLGFSPLQYGLVFGLNAAAMLVVNWGSARLIGRFRVRAILGFGLGAMVVAVLGFAIAVFVGLPAGWIIAFLTIAVGSIGAVMPKATAEAIRHVPHRAGSASAVLGSGQFAVGAAVTPLVNLAGADVAWTLGLVMLGCAVASAVGYLAVGRAAEPPVRPR